LQRAFAIKQRGNGPAGPSVLEGRNATPGQQDPRKSTWKHNAPGSGSAQTIERGGGDDAKKKNNNRKMPNPKHEITLTSPTTESERGKKQPRSGRETRKEDK